MLMRKFIVACVLALLAATAIAEDKKAVVLGSGERVVLHDNGTWTQAVEEPAGISDDIAVSPELVKNPKTPDEALTIYDTTLLHRDINYRKAITLALHYKNKSAKRVTGVVSHVKITNAFGKTILSKTFEDETSVEPGKLHKADTYWHFDDNPFIAGEAYDLLWAAVDNNTAKVSTKVMKVVFEDGTTVSAKAAAPAVKRKK